MSSVNKAIIVGRLTKAPEVRFLNDGTAVASFSMATNESWTDSSGQRQERADFHRIVVWKALAENCGKYLDKGSKVYVEGPIRYREYEDKDGNKRHITEIVAREVKFLDSKRDDGDDSRSEKRSSGNSNNRRSRNDQPAEDVDGIPF